MLQNLLSTYYYWFNFRPELLSKKIILLLVILGIGALVNFIWLLKINKKKSSYRKVSIKLENFALANWIVLWLMAFFYYEAIPFLSAKFWLLFWLIGNIIWGWNIYLVFKKTVVTIENQKENSELKKYIPKKAS